MCVFELYVRREEERERNRYFERGYVLILSFACVCVRVCGTFFLGVV